MGHLTWKAARLAGSAAFLCSATVIGASVAVAAGNKPEQKPDAGEAQANEQASKKSLEAGIKSFEAGRYQPAIDQLSTALRSGGLAGPSMAKALYMRGMAYKKQGKPGLAISDLTSALWLKNGLSESDRAAATAERAEAYRTAGLGDGNSGVERIAVADPNASKSAPASQAKPPAPAAEKAVSIPAPIPEGADASASVTRLAADSEKAQDAARARAAAAAPVDPSEMQSAAMGRLIEPTTARPAAAAPVATPAETTVAAVSPAPAAAVPAASGPSPSSLATTTVGTSGAPAAAPTLSALPTENSTPAAETPANPLAGAGNSIAGFFSNIFSGSSSAPAGAVTTASTTPAPPEAQTSSWSQGTTVAEPGSREKTRNKAVQLAAATPDAKPAPKGKYKLHIAAVRSRSEAEALAQKVQSQYGADLASRSPTVDEAVIGSMGTFYRVRVNGFASQQEPQGVCEKLRSGGLDCLVVTN